MERAVEVVFQEASFFKKIIDVLKCLADKATFVFTVQGMHVQVLDAGHFSLIHINLSQNSFQSFKCTEPTDINFDLVTLAKLLKFVSPTDTLTIRANMDEDIDMQLNSPIDGKSTQFRLKHFDLQQDFFEIPEHNYHGKLTINVNTFNQLIQSLSGLDDSMTVRGNGGQIQFSSKNPSVEATTSFVTRINPGRIEDEVNVQVTESFQVGFELQYLQVLLNASSFSKRVSLSFSPNFPLLIEYPLGSGGFFQYYLAPKALDDPDPDPTLIKSLVHLLGFNSKNS